MTDRNDKDKKAKGTKRLKFEDYKNCLKVTQLENKINQLGKNEVNVHNLKESLYKKVKNLSKNKEIKEFIKNNKLLLKSQQRFRSQKHNVFTEEVNKIALSANDDKKIQSTDSLEKYVYGRSKDLICKKEETKCNNIIKQCKK